MQLLLGVEQLDLQQSVSWNGLRDGSEVTAVYIPASDEEVKALRVKATGGEVMDAVDVVFWQTLPALNLTSVPANLALPSSLVELTLDLEQTELPPLPAHTGSLHHTLHQTAKTQAALEPNAGQVFLGPIIMGVAAQTPKRLYGALPWPHYEEPKIGL